MKGKRRFRSYYREMAAHQQAFSATSHSDGLRNVSYGSVQHGTLSMSRTCWSVAEINIIGNSFVCVCVCVCV
jgi:hypothetical protein